MDARAVCQADGGDLVKITDDSMSKFVWDLLSVDRGQRYWIGLHDRINEDKFVWLDEENETQYTKWAYNQPNNLRARKTGQDCVELGASIARPREWNDAICTSLVKFICERSAAG